MIRRRVSAPVAMLAVIGIVHRTVALLRFRHALDNLVAQKPGYVTMQLLPIADLRAHLWRSLWLLQQSPPLDQLVIKAALLAPWPYGTACALCAFNAALTIATACVLYGIIARVAGSRILAVCLSCWFLLSTDTLVMEYALFGQVFYEMLGMFGATAVCALLVRMEGRTGSGATRLSAAAGLATALTALAAPPSAISRSRSRPSSCCAGAGAPPPPSSCPCCSCRAAGPSRTPSCTAASP